MCWWSLRPDGVGNRLEQISNLLDNFDPSASASMGTNKMVTTLIWPAQRTGTDMYRGLSRWLRIDGALLIEDDSTAVQKLMAEQPKCSLQTEPGANVTVMELNERRIHPNFNISFPSELPERPVGVHIRTTDRMSKDDIQRQYNDPSASFRDQTSFQESLLAIELTTQALLDQKPRAVFIASDNPQIAETLAKTLQTEGIEVVIPSVDPPHVDPIFVDFFGLTLCSQVWMVSSFSSFSIMSARVGKARLYSLLPEQVTALYRYHVPDVQRIPGAQLKLEQQLQSSWALWTAKNNEKDATTSDVATLPLMVTHPLFFPTVAFATIIICQLLKLQKRRQIRPNQRNRRYLSIC